MSVVVTAGGGRGNGLDTAGWDAVMDGLAGATAVTSLNGVDRLGDLFRGWQAAVALGGGELGVKEAAAAVGRLLRRSEATLTTLALRWVAASLGRSVEGWWWCGHYGTVASGTCGLAGVMRVCGGWGWGGRVWGGIEGAGRLGEQGDGRADSA